MVLVLQRGATVGYGFGGTHYTDWEGSAALLVE